MFKSITLVLLLSIFAVPVLAHDDHGSVNVHKRSLVKTCFVSGYRYVVEATRYDRLRVYLNAVDPLNPANATLAKEKLAIKFMMASIVNSAAWATFRRDLADFCIKLVNGSHTTSDSYNVFQQKAVKKLTPFVTELERTAKALIAAE